MKIFIDFDDVLFNTKKFKEDLQNLFFQHGISREVFDFYYHNHAQKKILKTYDPWGHLELISKGEGIDVENIKKDLGDFMTDTNPYLFDDSVDFLKKFEKVYVCIVSYGESKFQGMKIGECRVGKYCEEIQITEELKSQVMTKLLKNRKEGEDVYFLEDRIEQLEDVKKNLHLLRLS